jgi:hypothetical protein
MELSPGILAAIGPYWIPGTIALAVLALVVFSARGGRGGQEMRMSRRRAEQRPPD